MLQSLGPALAGFFIFPVTGEPQCPSAWSVLATRDPQVLTFTMSENGTQGPACDLVVQRFEYDETLGLLDLRLQPARFCPIDAQSSRQAEFSWRLPQELRQSADLILVINGSLWGTLQLSSQSVTTEGACP